MRRLIVLAIISALAVVACGGSGGSGASGKDSRFCQDSRTFSSNFQFGTTVDYKARFQQLDAKISQFQSEAPAEIKSDVNTLIGAVHQFENSVKAHNYTVDPSFLASFSDPKVTQASTRISDYDSRVCGLSVPTR